jgi:hypothetical protein
MQAMDTLVKAETAAANEEKARRPKGEVQVYPAGTEFKVRLLLPCFVPVICYSSSTRSFDSGALPATISLFLVSPSVQQISD